VRSAARTRAQMHVQSSVGRTRPVASARRRRIDIAEEKGQAEASATANRGARGKGKDPMLRFFG
jgi:hypothetical protein